MLKTLDHELVEILVDLLTFTTEELQYLNNLQQQKNEQGQFIQVPLYIKMAMRCLTSCLRVDLALTNFLSSYKPIEDVIKLIHIVKDEEVVANGCKSVRICFRDPQVYNLDECVIILCRFWIDLLALVMNTLTRSLS